MLFWERTVPENRPMKILGGIYTKDAGSILINGRKFRYIM